MSDAIGKRSRELFDSGYFCAESILLAIAEHYKIQSELIPKIATGLCGGMARTNGYCGAFTGGILAINLLTGRTEPDASVDMNYQLVQQFLSKFLNKYNSQFCYDLIQCDLSQPEEMERFRSMNLIETCKQITEVTTGMVLEVIENSDYILNDNGE
ncbi:C-GCAxxG-C-C family protein [bacterium]